MACQDGTRDGADWRAGVVGKIEFEMICKGAELRKGCVGEERSFRQRSIMDCSNIEDIIDYGKSVDGTLVLTAIPTAISVLIIDFF